MCMLNLTFLFTKSISRLLIRWAVHAWTSDWSDSISTAYLLFTYLPLFFVFVFSFLFFVLLHLPPPGVCLWISSTPSPLVCFLRLLEGGEGVPSGWVCCLREEQQPYFGSLLISLFSLLGDFHHGNPIRIRRSPAGEGTLPGGVCLSVCVCVLCVSHRIKHST